MPSFGRMGKHSNRSQNALATAQEPSTPASAGAAVAVGPGPGSVAPPPSQQQQQQQQQQAQTAGTPSAATASPQAPASAPSAATIATGQNLNNINNNSSKSNTNTNSPLPPPPPSSATPQEPHSASSSTAFGSNNDSFDNSQQPILSPQQRQQLLHAAGAQDTPPRPPPHDYDNPSSLAQVGRRGSQPLHNPSHIPFDPRQRNPQQQQQQQQQQQDFIENVSRSQSQRYSVATPYHLHNPYGAASSSVDDLQTTIHYPPPGPGQQLPPPPQQQQQQPETKSRSSARRLIKNIFSGKDQHQSQHHHQQQLPHHPHPHGHPNPHHHHQHSQSQQLPPPPQLLEQQSSSLGRRPSKRVRNPPNIPTGVSQVSQLSLDQPSNWQPHTVDTQPSPLQGHGDFDDQYFARDSNRDNLVQDPQHEANRNSIRYVQSDIDSSPYEDINFQQQHQQPTQQPLSPQQQQQQLPPLLQQPSPDQQVQYGQAIFDPSPQQQQQQQYQRPDQLRGQSHFPGGPPPIVTTTTTGHLIAGQQQPNAETISQLSHESPATDSDARSAHQQLSAQGSPAVNFSAQVQDNSPLPPTSAGPSPQQQGPPQQRNMAPGVPPSDRRAPGSEKTLRGSIDAPPGAPSGYRHSQPPGAPPGGPNNNTLRAGTGQERPPGFEGSGTDQGRNSPQPSNPDATDPDKFKELLTKYKNVKRLFFDGKAQIEQLNGQVEQLQNAVANQRITQSRTALDDGEYLTRFNRLNGAINNLSFNVRKDWKSVPQWLDRCVSPDALKTGKQEMMAVGRAVITRWLVEEIFNKCFHPGLSFELSRQLKEIERNIRNSSYTLNAQEEYEAHTNKIVSWRMATLDGLQPVLGSQQSVEFRQDFTRMCTSNLTAALYQYLTDPPPPGVDGSATTIVELAVGIAANLPIESRDVCITYPLPGELVNTNIMEVEKTALPPLENGLEDDQEEDDEDELPEKAGAKGGRPEKGRGAPSKDIPKIRFAAFLAVEVRSRQVLLKAPVWTLG